MKKRPTLYIIIIAVWLGCVALLGYALANIIIHLNGYSAVKQGFIISLLVVLVAIAVEYAIGVAPSGTLL